ncbi:MAG: hypothetical protein AAGE96_00940, partial [Cyanobacteria bacterium P01_G01_bin.19]
IEEIEQYWAGDRLQMLRIIIDLNTIRRFVTKLNTVPQPLQRFCYKNDGNSGIIAIKSYLLNLR